MNNLPDNVSVQDLPEYLPHPSERMSREQLLELIDRPDVFDWSNDGGADFITNYFADTQLDQWPKGLRRAFEDWFIEKRAAQRVDAIED